MPLDVEMEELEELLPLAARKSTDRYAYHMRQRIRPHTLPHIVC
jgi:hypothetical protein